MGSKPVERLFPFVLRARVLVVGRDALRHNLKKLEFVLLTEDLSENSRREMATDLGGVPLIQRYTSGDLENFFGLRGTKIVGFKKSSLARSIYRELISRGLPLEPPGAREKKDEEP